MRHENWKQLAEFSTSVYAEYMNPGSELRRYFRAGLTSPIQEAFQQYIIEVGNGYGFGGISHMTPEQWFNDDSYLPRAQHADQIATFYERYQAVVDDEVKESKQAEAVNEVQAELIKIRAELAKLTEAAAAKKGEEGSAEEEDTESDDEAEAEGDTAKSKKG